MARNHRQGVLYSRFSGYYDTLFQWITLPRQHALLRTVKFKPGDRVLDLGVGTGLALPFYPRHCRVTAVDISPRMLEHARRRVERKRLTNVELLEFDAAHIDQAFSPHTFDFIIAAFVMSVVNDAEKVMRNLKVIGKPDCTILIINHFKSGNPVIEKCEKAIEPLCRKLGWTYELDLEEITALAGLRIVHNEPCYPYDPYRIVHVKNGIHRPAP